MKKYKVGIVIGRFQPFHLGHKFLIEEALKISEKIIIGVGSSNISNLQNPYSLKKRKRFLQDFIREEGLNFKIFKIVPLVDDFDDDVWFSKLLNKTGKFDVGIGDNEWVNGIFAKNNIPIVRVGLYKRDILEGKVIRELMKDNKKWVDRVPQYIVPSIE